MSSNVSWEDHCAVVEVVNTYARACDERRFDLLHEVFTEDLVSVVNGVATTGREARIASIRRHLGGCGPTQHLLGNVSVRVEGDTAHSCVAVRAFHAGAGERSHLTYEMFGTYDDELRRTEQGWRITHRRMTVTHERGTREVLQPG